MKSPFVKWRMFNFNQNKQKSFLFYLSKETLKGLILEKLKLDLINIEKSLTHGQKISGHYVQGHVDTTASKKY